MLHVTQTKVEEFVEVPEEVHMAAGGYVIVLLATQSPSPEVALFSVLANLTLIVHLSSFQTFEFIDMLNLRIRLISVISFYSSESLRAH